MKKDYYKILGVSKDASEEEIKQAFRRLAKQYHPDANPHASEEEKKRKEEKFKEIQEAYAVLSDPEKRAQYDRFGEVPGFEFDFSKGFGFDFDFSDLFEDVFESFFGTRKSAKRGDDIYVELWVELEEIVRDTQRRIQVQRLERCTACGGGGQKAGTSPSLCPHCKGSGVIHYRTGLFSVSRTCNHCGGKGRVIQHPCPQCRGTGKEKVERTINIKVPAGIEDGARLRLSGEGNEGEGGRGDLYVLIRTKPHKIFKREGNDIICEVPISFTQAALGAEIEVPTLDGRTTLHIPAGTQPDKIFKLKGKGLPYLHGYGRGDEYVRIKIVIPTSLSEKEKALLRELARLRNEKIDEDTSFGKFKKGVFS